MKTISYAITACDEHEELDKLLQQLDRNIRDADEVVIQVDTNVTEEVLNVISKYLAFSLVQFPLNNDFASFKNNLIKHCTRDYIFYIDADEFMSINLELSLPEILELNPEVDLFYVPRINLVEGLTQEHIQKWGWNINEHGHINYPDYQSRIIKNKPEIKYVNKVHERIIGHRTSVELPAGFELIHYKTIERQERQNNFYSQL